MTPEIKDGLLRVPHGGGEADLYLNLKEIALLERRLDEIHAVTRMKAPELLGTFTKAWNDLHQDVVTVQAHLVLAKREVDKVKAVVLLDKVPTILKEKGLVTEKRSTGSDDLRKAILSLDPEYQVAVERQDYLECVYELLKGKLKTFQMGYEAVKKILGEGSYLDQMNGAVHAPKEAEFENHGFGTPKYR